MAKSGISGEFVDAILTLNPRAKLWGHLDPELADLVEARRRRLVARGEIVLPHLPPGVFDPAEPLPGPLPAPPAPGHEGWE